MKFYSAFAIAAFSLSSTALVQGYGLLPRRIMRARIAPPRPIVRFYDRPGSLWRESQALVDRVDQMFEETLSLSDRMDKVLFGVRPKTLSPRIQIQSDDEKIQIDMKLPVGDFEPSNIDVSVDKNVVTMKGKYKTEMNNIISSYKFSQSFYLDPAVEKDKLTANMKNGILTLSAPKNMKLLEETVKKIPVEMKEAEATEDEKVEVSKIEMSEDAGVPASVSIPVQTRTEKSAPKNKHEEVVKKIPVEQKVAEATKDKKVEAPEKLEMPEDAGEPVSLSIPVQTRTEESAPTNIHKEVAKKIPLGQKEAEATEDKKEEVQQKIAMSEDTSEPASVSIPVNIRAKDSAPNEIHGEAVKKIPVGQNEAEATKNKNVKVPQKMDMSEDAGETASVSIPVRIVAEE